MYVPHVHVLINGAVTLDTVDQEIFSSENFIIFFNFLVFYFCHLEKRRKSFAVYNYNLKLTHVNSQDKSSMKTYEEQFAMWFKGL